jgi:hypothetical protein
VINAVALNWYKGFNRLFVLAAAGWAIYILIVALVVVPNKERNAASDTFNSALDDCIDQSQKDYDNFVQELKSRPMSTGDYSVIEKSFTACYQRATRRYKDAVAYASLRNQFAAWGDRFRVLAALIVPPAAAYGVFLALAWALRGFRKPAP